MNPFELQSHLDSLYATTPPRLAFRTQTLAEFTRWQGELRARLQQLLGLAGREPVPVAAEPVAVVDRGSYVEEKISLAVGEQVQTPLYLLVPKSEPPFKAIVAFHGHDPGVQFIMGNYPDDETAAINRRDDNNYAQALAEAGYLVCAVEQRGLGQRLTAQTGDSRFPQSCRHLAFTYMLQGRSLLGERCWDGMCAISYLQTRPEVRQDVLGSTGHSGGGTTTLFLAVLDPRITAVVVSGYFCSFQASILAMHHCECNYLPGILELAEMGDVAALIAPRPLCVVHGRDDAIFPVPATIEQFETVRRAYGLHGRSEACALAIHPGGHAYHHPSSQAWFKHWC